MGAGGVRADRRRPAPARRGRRRSPPRSRPPAAGSGTASVDAPDSSRWWPIRAGEAPSSIERVRRRRGGSAAGGAAAGRRAARRGRGRGGTGSRRWPARRCRRASARSRWSNASSSGSPDSATNSSVSNVAPTTATRCSTSRVAGGMPPIMWASRAIAHRGSVGGPPGQLVDRERDAAAERRDLVDQLGRRVGRRGGGRARRHRRRRAGRATISIAPWRSSRLRRVSASVSDIGAGRWASTMQTAVVAGRAGDVVEQAQAGVVGVVDVVDGEQQPVRRRREADELGRGDEQALVRARPVPRRPRRRPARGRSPRGGGRRARRAASGAGGRGRPAPRPPGAYGHAPSTGRRGAVPDAEAQSRAPARSPRRAATTCRCRPAR